MIDVALSEIYSSNQKANNGSIASESGSAVWDLCVIGLVIDIVVIVGIIISVAVVVIVVVVRIIVVIIVAILFPIVFLITAVILFLCKSRNSHLNCTSA